ncbi:MAG: hypothetical protein KBI47_12350 [Armatimonadetes bacterium]|nr:hypothetical protein [Armatimonadota bacterium]
MSIELSAESIFIARNWETVAEIVQATKQLRGEMDRLLAGLKDGLQERAWWDENWTFLVRRSGAVCIARQTWKSSEDYLVRICIDRFTPESVFGLDDPPYLLCVRSRTSPGCLRQSHGSYW